MGMVDIRPHWLGLRRGSGRSLGGILKNWKILAIDLNSTPVPPGSDGVVDLSISLLDDNQVFFPRFVRGRVLNESIEKLNTSSGPWFSQEYISYVGTIFHEKSCLWVSECIIQCREVESIFLHWHCPRTPTTFRNRICVAAVQLFERIPSWRWLHIYRQCPVN